MNEYATVPLATKHQYVKSIFELTSDELQDYWVSEFSQFKDDRWKFKNNTAGSQASASVLNWGMTLYDGSALLEVIHDRRLDWSKKLMLTMLKTPTGGRAPAPGSMSGHQQCFKWLLSWMTEKELFLPDELTQEVVEFYIDDLPRFIVECKGDDDDDDVLAPASVRRALDILSDLWRQRVPMRRMGQESIDFDPFAGRSIVKFADDIAGKGIGWIRPLPDEVAVPLFNKSFEFLDVPADDLLKLIRFYIPLPNEDLPQRKARILKEIESFQFSLKESEATPWHPQLKTLPVRSEKRNFASTNAVRNLVLDLIGASVLTVQGNTGMRISEICGLRSGINPDTGLPIDVKIEKSLTGLYEWFVITSQLSKGTGGVPVLVDWVLGMREVGTDLIPPAVKALQVLDKLYSPWRKSAKEEKLILGLSGHVSLPLTTNRLSGIFSDSLRRAMKNFITNWVDLSHLPDEGMDNVGGSNLLAWKESKGQIFKTQMLRKSWANFVLAVDPGLLSTIQMQFHHLSLATTEGAYIGRNPLLVENINSVSRQRRNAMIFETVVGTSPLAGRMGQQLENAVIDLKNQLLGLSNPEKWSATMAWGDAQDLQLFFSKHATCCPVKTSQMRCHDVSSTPIWLRRSPNYVEQEPSMCAGCACAIMDKTHEPFWSDRYVKCHISMREAKIAKIEGRSKIISDRADQAKKILKKFGVNMDALESRIDSHFKETYAEKKR